VIGVNDTPKRAVIQRRPATMRRIAPHRCGSAELDLGVNDTARTSGDSIPTDRDTASASAKAGR